MNKFINFAAVVIFVSTLALPSRAQEPSSEVVSPTAEESPAAEENPKVDKSKGDGPVKPKMVLRLPRYFASIVSDVQRQEINEIQRSYIDRTQALQEQLDALKKEELAAIEQLLSEPQREQLEEMRMNAPQRAKPMPKSVKQPDSKKSKQASAPQNAATATKADGATKSTVRTSRAKGGQPLETTDAQVD